MLLTDGTNSILKHHGMEDVLRGDTAARICLVGVPGHRSQPAPPSATSAPTARCFSVPFSVPWKTFPGCEQLPARGAMPSEGAVPTARGKSPEAGGHPRPAGVGHPGSLGNNNPVATSFHDQKHLRSTLTGKEKGRVGP